MTQAITRDPGIIEHVDDHVKQSPNPEKKKSKFVWSNFFIFIIFHFGGVYGFYVLFFKVKWLTVLFAFFVSVCAGLGITAGAHRLWAHKAYKARLPLQILLVIFNTLCLQGSVIDWVRDHRMHHKYTETDADPHNAKRGFFFSHIGWLLVRKHPDIKAKGHTIDMSDVRNNPILNFQYKYFFVLGPLASIVIPTLIPTLWGESLLNALVSCSLYRCLHQWHVTYLINSYAHLYGPRPYDKKINPAESKWISFLTLGEGHHNYHHTFPWDYKTAELGILSNGNGTTLFIDFMAKLGLAYDLKSASDDMIRQRVERTGDGSHTAWGVDDQNLANTEKIQ